MYLVRNIFQPLISSIFDALAAVLNTGKIWYVTATDSGGTGTGEKDDPFQTFSNIPTDGTVQPGDTIDGLNETHTENLSCPVEGADGKYITYRNMNIDGNSTLTSCVECNNKSFIKLKNISASDTTYAMVYLRNGCGYIHISHCNFSGDGIGILGAANTTELNNLTIEYNKFSNNSHGTQLTTAGSSIFYDITHRYNEYTNSGYGFRMRQTSLTDFENGVLAYGIASYGNTYTGIRLAAIDFSAGIKAVSGHQSYVKQEYCYQVGLNSTSGDVNAIQTHCCDGLIIEQNYIEATQNQGNSDGQAIIIDWYNADSSLRSKNCIIRDNYIVNNTSGDDSAGIGLWSSENAEVYRNIIINNELGVKLGGDSNNTGNVIYNNLIEGNESGVLCASNAPELIVINNIISNNSTAFDLKTGAATPDESYNCIYNNTSNGLTLDSTDITSNPKLTPTYRLYPDSPCLDAGIEVITNYENYLLHSEDLTDSVWDATDATKDTSTITFTAQNGVVTQTRTVSADADGTFTFWASSISGNTNLQVVHENNDNGDGDYSNITLTSTLTKYVVRCKTDSSGTALKLGIRDPNSSNFAKITFTKAQYYSGTVDRDYIKTEGDEISSLISVSQAITPASSWPDSVSLENYDVNTIDDDDFLSGNIINFHDIHIGPWSDSGTT